MNDLSEGCKLYSVIHYFLSIVCYLTDFLIDMCFGTHLMIKINFLKNMPKFTESEQNMFNFQNPQTTHIILILT